jgi:NAD(P)-dependent dehydrogenase (short-subunit alcohol dehydrogenase family)
MKTLLIGAGTLGGEIKKLLEEKGHEVVSATRASHPAVDISIPSSIDGFYGNLGMVDAIICAAGDAAFKSLEELADKDVVLSVTSKLSGQVNIVRKGIQNLNPGGVFVITGGTLAYTPGPQTSLITMVNLGLEGFAKGAALDLKDGKRIVIVHPPFVKETAAMFGMDTSPWPSAKDAAKAYLVAVEGNMTGEPVFVEGYKPL